MTYVTFRDIEGGLYFKAPLGPVTPKVNSGSGWEEVSRPSQKAFSDWNGSGLVKVQFDILFDGFMAEESQQADFNRLQDMYWPRNGGRTRPTRVNIFSPAINLGAGRDWIINDMQMGEGYRSSDSKLLRQNVSIELWEYESPDVLKKTLKQRSKKSHKRKYTVKRGDTLMSIAHRQLGDSNRWREIQRLNPSVKDPRHLTVGKKLTIAIVATI